MRQLPVILAAAICLVGCNVETRAPTLVHPYQAGRPGQEPSLDLSAYKSVQTRLGQDSRLAVAVAISGGGNRAGNFGVGVMLALEALANEGGTTNALREVDYFSTVSGGGLAPAAYVSSLHDFLATGGRADEYSLAKVLAGPAGADGPRWDGGIRTHLSEGFVGDIVRGALAWTPDDRGQYLNEAFDDKILGRKWRRENTSDAPLNDGSLTLGDMFVPAGADRPVRLPYWAANSTIFENGAIFAFMPDELRRYQVTGYTHRRKQVHCTAAADSPEYAAFLALMPLSQGQTASGAFPAAIPATALQSRMDARNPYLLLVDGGVADMLGVISAVRLLRQDNHAAVQRRVLIVVDATVMQPGPFSNVKSDPGVSCTAIRTYEMFASSWRGRYREIVRGLCAKYRIEPIFLSFDDLADFDDGGGNPLPMDVLLKRGLAQDDVDVLSKELDLSGEDLTPYHAVRRVATWYSVTPAEQKLLLAAGQFVVERRAKKIRAALGWK